MGRRLAGCSRGGLRKGAGISIACLILPIIDAPLSATRPRLPTVVGSPKGLPAAIMCIEAGGGTGRSVHRSKHRLHSKRPVKSNTAIKETNTMSLDDNEMIRAQPMAMRANLSGFLESPVILYWNLDKN